MKKASFAKRSLGQNFLVDESVISRIIRAVDPKPGALVIEIGPGRGALTERLLESQARVIAIELDRDLVPMLRDQFAVKGDFTVLESDATTVDYDDLIGDEGPCKLVANLPYYISTAILQHLAQNARSFSSLVLMFQREVVERIAAEPGNSDRGFLTVLVETAFHVERLFDVPPRAFRPQPKIWSTVVRLTPKELNITDSSRFRALVSAAFAQKRKTILNNLKATFPNAAGALEAANIDPARRAETLTLDEWLRLNEAIRT